MKTLIAPEGTDQLVIGDDTYTADEHGNVSVPHSHAETAIILGCVDPDAPVEGPTPILPDVPAEAIPELNEALARENEELKAEVSALTAANEELTSSLEQTADAIDKLRDALQGAGVDPDTVLRPTESAEETQSGAAGADSAESDQAALLPLLPDEMPDFNDVEAFTRDTLRDWLTGRGVATPGNISREAAASAATDTYVSQKAAQDAAKIGA